MDVDLIIAYNNNDIKEIKYILDNNEHWSNEKVFLYSLLNSKTNTQTIKFIIDYYEKINRKINIHISGYKFIMILYGIGKTDIFDYLIYLSKHNYSKYKVSKILYNMLDNFVIEKICIKDNIDTKSKKYIYNNIIIFINDYINFNSTDYLFYLY